MKKILSFCIVALFVLPGMAQNSANLKMNLEKNKVYRFKSSSEQTVVQSVNGNQQTVETKSDNAISLKMIDFTPTLLVAEVRIDTMRTSGNSTGKPATMTSAVEGNIKSAETTDIISCIMNRMSKAPVYVKMDYAGKPSEIVNSAMLSSIILKDTSSITLTGVKASAVKKQISEMISDNSLKTLIGSFTNVLPAKEVAVGETWVKTDNLNSGGMALEITTTFKLDGISGNSANVTAVSEIRPAANATPIQSGAATVTYDSLSGMTKSSLVIDTKTGLVTEEKAKTHISGNLGISGPGFSMQMPMDINGTSNIVAY